MNPDLIRSLTPLFLGGLGALAGSIVALAAILSPNLATDRFWAAITFSSTIIGTFGGAAGGSAIPGNQRPTQIQRADEVNINESKSR
jgi:hypothetical protein